MVLYQLSLMQVSYFVNIFIFFQPRIFTLIRKLDGKIIFVYFSTIFNDVISDVKHL